MPVMSDRIRTSKSSSYCAVAMIHVLWLSILLLTLDRPFDWAHINESASLLWLVEITAVITLSVSLFYGSIFIKRMATVLGISIDLLAVFY